MVTGLPGILIGTETSHHGNCTVIAHHTWYSLVQGRATPVMRDETHVQERYICLDCSVWDIPKLNLEETRYLPTSCELNSRNTDENIKLQSVTDNCKRYAATLAETEWNTLKPVPTNGHLQHSSSCL